MKRSPGRPRKRIRSDQYRPQCYVLPNATIERLQGAVERGRRSEFVKDAVNSALDELQVCEDCSSHWKGEIIL